MPAAVYTRGFIRTYCQYLGLESRGDAGPVRAAEGDPGRVQIRPIPAEINTPRSIPFRPAVVLAGLIVASLLVVYLWGQYTSFQQNLDQIDAAPPSRASTPAIGAARAPSPSPVATPAIALAGASPSPAASPVLAPERGLIVDAKVTDRTWMEVWVDGQSVMAETRAVWFRAIVHGRAAGADARRERGRRASDRKWTDTRAARGPWAGS